MTLSLNLDLYVDWERAVILAHELQHAVDHANAVPFDGTSNCLAREGDAFRRQSEVWHELWRSMLAVPQNQVQFQLDDIANSVQSDPDAFAESFAHLYRYHRG